MDFSRKLFHTLCIVLLTLISQIGGVVYMLSILLVHKSQSRAALKRLGVFVLFYIISNQVVVPYTALLFGREQVQEGPQITAAMPLTRWLNRNYVKPELNHVLQQVAQSLDQKYSGVKLVYLDACFPFFDGFPLLPHLSHRDGRKIDLAFLYEGKEKQLVNDKPSRSGYGVFENPLAGEVNTASFCQSNGYWQYDYPKYLTLGGTAKDLRFAEEGNRFLIKLLLQQPPINKLFIEPHLKTRLSLNHPKIRFHGCGAVRHDDHIHIQL